jgi:hypothetical protein
MTDKEKVDFINLVCKLYKKEHDSGLIKAEDIFTALSLKINQNASKD